MLSKLAMISQGSFQFLSRDRPDQFPTHQAPTDFPLCKENALTFGSWSSTLSIHRTVERKLHASYLLVVEINLTFRTSTL